jgi:hypothetical protein
MDMLYSCLYEGIQCDDAINRKMVRVVATVIHVSRDACRASRLTAFLHDIHTVRVWAIMDLL